MLFLPILRYHFLAHMSSELCLPQTNLKAGFVRAIPHSFRVISHDRSVSHILQRWLSLGHESNAADRSEM